ncbi:MAG: hypothetical protein KKG33_06730 [candidate division Zixibacteria bacterium]|nr:hypothetical protein [candidate division Zixibacteria bacterium]MBU1471997.1 hypothetical protein [candidate division Zixibacteria bacterium]MBU2625237.1 hypothetical protein [candidate division Zixibacteria bacterium]
MSGKQNQRPEAVAKEIRRQTRRKFTAEEKIRIVLEGRKGETVCRHTIRTRCTSS